jgi:hypothetical protein
MRPTLVSAGVDPDLEHTAVVHEIAQGPPGGTRAEAVEAAEL